MDNTYTVPVDGIGTFQVLRRNMRVEMRIGAEFARLTEGLEATQMSKLHAQVAGLIADLKVLIHEGPDGWDVDEMDPLDAESYVQLVAVHKEVRAAEDRFRGRIPRSGEAAGAGNGQEPGVVVPGQVPAGAD